MKKTVFMMLLGLLLTASVYADGYVEGNLLIHTTDALYVTQKEPQLTTNKGWFNALIPTYNISNLRQLGENNIPQGMDYFYYLVVFDTTFTVEDVQSEFSTKGEVIFAEPNALFDLYSGVNTNDTHADKLWGLEKIGMDSVWSEIGEYGDSSVVIAVHDTGIDLGLNPGDPIHEDLYANLWQDSLGYYGYNFYAECIPPGQEDPHKPQDLFGHGTHVSGTIGAMTNNGVGIAGIVGGWGAGNPGSKIMTIRAGNRLIPLVCCVNGLWYAYNNGADVVNMSWGGSTNSPTLQACVDSISSYEDAPLLVASCGNNGNDDQTYPASYLQVIAVAATDVNDEKCSFSTYGDWVDISAPGGKGEDPSTTKIYSTMPFDDQFYLYVYYGYQQEYDYMQGTSMACPHVVGLAGLIKSHFPGLTNKQIRGRIFGTSDDINSENSDYMYRLGAGRINAYRALTENEHPVIRYHDVVIEDGNNSIFECGETAEVQIKLKNWWADVENVSGTLSTDDPYITIEDSCGYWGNIEQEEIVTNNVNKFTISDNSIVPRTAIFTLHIEADSMYTCDIGFLFTIHVDTGTPLVSLPLSAGETITTEAVMSDIDNDGLDEIIIGSSEGYIYIYNNANVLSLDTNYPIDCTPACGDINNDGYDEIVAANDNGDVFIWDKDGNVIAQYLVDGICKHTIVLEDVTGDGQLEIIVSTQKSSTYPYNGVEGFHIIDQITDQIYTYDTSFRIKKPISVSDFDNDNKKEIVALIKAQSAQTTMYLKCYSVDGSFNISESFSTTHSSSNLGGYEVLSGPQIADIDEDNVKEILFNYTHGGITEGLYSGIVVFNFGESDPLWDVGLVADYATRCPLIIGNFDEYNTGLEIVYVCSLDEESCLISIWNHSGEIIDKSSEYIEQESDVLLTDMNDDGNQEIIQCSNYNFRLFTNSCLEASEWNIHTDEYNPFESISIGKVIAESNNHIVLITQDGTIYAFPVEYSEYSISEWPQYQNNSRNTGCYFQPLPEEIGTDITVKHNVVVDTKISFPIEEAEARLIISPGNEILFESGGLIEGRNIQAIGTEENPIIFSGLCADTTKNYWDGISIFGCDEAQFEHCTITNAEIGLFMENTENNIIKDCTVMYNDIGISLFTSSPFIRKNNISYNNYGIAGLHESMPILSNLDTLGVPFENAVVENEVNIFLDESGAYLDNGYNDIYSTFDNYIVLEDYPEEYLNARNNYWNSTVVEEILSHLVPPETFVIEPICEEPNWKISNPYLTTENQKLGEGYSYLLAGDYNNAATSFTELIATYPETNESDLGVVGLYSCYIGFKNQWDVLESYLDTLLVNPANLETTEKLLETYRNLCLRKKEEYTNAILNYEAILDNDPSYEDSCYAVIDIGNTYLEAQYAGKSAMGKYIDMIPKSYEAHQEITKDLLKSIIKGLEPSSNNHDVFDKPTLFQSYPNPCFNTTNIDYFIPQSSHVTLKIYNIKGQFVKKMYDDKREVGRYSIMWDGTDYNNKKLGNGVYFYKLDAGKHSTIKKLIMMR